MANDKKGLGSVEPAAQKRSRRVWERARRRQTAAGYSSLSLPPSFALTSERFGRVELQEQVMADEIGVQHLLDGLTRENAELTFAFYGFTALVSGHITHGLSFDTQASEAAKILHRTHKTLHRLVEMLSDALARLS